jgi:hypothetical protein
LTLVKRCSNVTSIDVSFTVTWPSFSQQMHFSSYNVAKPFELKRAIWIEAESIKLLRENFSIQSQNFVCRNQFAIVSLFWKFASSTKNWNDKLSERKRK